MKRRIDAAFIAPLMLTSMLAMSVQAHASTVIGFEGGTDPIFTYSGVNFFNSPIESGSGYNNVISFTGSTWGAYNPFEASPSSFFIAGGPTNTFTLESFVIAGSWGTQTLTIEGLNDGSLLFSSPLAISLTPTIFSPNWVGIDELRITVGSDFVDDPFLLGTGQHWALDNLTIIAVPEPETYIMLLAGLGMVGFMARRRKNESI